jgi:DNA-binding NarL/FixJ family response regulator
MYTIFLADDHTIVRNGLRRIIEEHSDYKVIGETGDGLQIVPLIKKLQPDMIILDISMPYLRGIEAISKIKKINKKVKILILTIHKNKKYVCECLMYGAQGYILKEDAVTELITAIKSMQQDKIYVSSSFSNDVIKKLVQRKDNPGNRNAWTTLMVLTNREREVLKLITEGYSSKKIAGMLSISIRTVEHHRLSIMRKLNVTNAASLVRYAIKNNFVD